MSKGTISQQAFAFEMFIHQQGKEPSGSGTSQEVFDDLSKSSTGNSSSPFVPQYVGPFWTPPPQKKRGREDETSSPQPKERKLSFSLEDDDVVKTIFTRLMVSLLATHGVGEISLHDFFSTAFLGLPPDHLRQVMSFLEKDVRVWVLERILMEIPHLNVQFTEYKDVILSLSESFTFCSFNMNMMLSQYRTFFMESIVLHQSACQERHEEELRQQEEKLRRNQLNKRFIKALWTLWKTNDINSFFQELIAVCPEFNSGQTNWDILKKVVYEFLTRIYNAFHRAYHNGEPCEVPKRVFIEYATTSGVFSPRAQIGVVIPICSSLKEVCHLGERCSGAHQDFISSGWSTETALSAVCIQYAKKGVCHNKNCRFAHCSDDEFNAGLRKLKEQSSYEE
jgi:hypothetical protein